MSHITQELIENQLSLLGFKYEISKSGKYKVWYDLYDDSLYTTTPNEKNNSEFFDFLERNLSVIRTKTGFLDYNLLDLRSQIERRHYKLINRINTDSQTVPIDYVTTLINATKDCFYYFASISKKAKKVDLEIGHTSKGSYTIPIIIPIDEAELKEYLPILNQESLTGSIDPISTHQIISEFLKEADKLNDLETNDISHFLGSANELGLKASFIEHFTSLNKPFAPLSTKYKNRIEGFELLSDINPLLDYRLDIGQKEFKKTKLLFPKPIFQDFIDDLKDQETIKDQRDLSETDVYIKAAVTNLTRSKTELEFNKARISIIDIYDQNNTSILNNSDSFVSKIDNIGTEYYNLLADASKTRSEIFIRGAITKKPGKMGECIILELNKFDEIKLEPPLF